MNAEMHAELYLKIKTKIIRTKDMETKFLKNQAQPAMQNAMTEERKELLLRSFKDLQKEQNEVAYFVELNIKAIENGTTKAFASALLSSLKEANDKMKRLIKDFK